ncbi:hypothetical protein RUM43_008808 [Polyplax serrata]|uniref:Uncharacterized protein n=1 Tax=Polyplax serrata TaxID=468196 RepID=A0AAN8NYY7_POLSC
MLVVYLRWGRHFNVDCKTFVADQKFALSVGTVVSDFERRGDADFHVSIESGGGEEENRNKVQAWFQARGRNWELRDLLRMISSSKIFMKGTPEDPTKVGERQFGRKGKLANAENWQETMKDDEKNNGKKEMHKKIQEKTERWKTVRFSLNQRAFDPREQNRTTWKSAEFQVGRL